jgi:replicative DNA helicase
MSMLAPVASTDARVAPHNLEAEQSTLGGMLLSEEAVAEVIEITSGADFYASKHELIFDAVVTLFGRGEPTDVIAVTDQLNKNGNLLKAGGADYLHSLTSYVPTAANAGYYAKIVADKAVLRRLIDAGTKIAQSGYESQGEVEDLVNQAQSEIYRVASQNAKDDYVGLSDSLEDAIREIESAQNRGGEMTGIATGFTDLDSYTHGLHPGQLIIVAARPAVGKSTFALDIARHAAVKQKKATIFFSLEMGRAEIAMRMLSAESSIYLQSMTLLSTLTTLQTCLWLRFVRSVADWRSRLISRWL